jgi:hypothetical protein
MKIIINLGREILLLGSVRELIMKPSETSSGKNVILFISLEWLFLCLDKTVTRNPKGDINKRANKALLRQNLRIPNNKTDPTNLVHQFKNLYVRL